MTQSYRRSFPAGVGRKRGIEQKVDLEFTNTFYHNSTGSGNIDEDGEYQLQIKFDSQIAFVLR
jgi:hypothetical protein